MKVTRWTVTLLGALLLSLAVLASACQPAAPGAATQPSSQSPTARTATPITATHATAAPQITPPAGPVRLHVWVPPEFNPSAENEAARLLRARIKAFAAENQGVEVEVRVKALEGAGGLLDALTNASAAAPLALPDLVALPRPMLEAAALKGVLHPFDGLTTVTNEADWYDYALQLGRLQSSTYGLPFAGDALTLIYRPSGVSAPPPDWPRALKSNKPMIFAAADSQALVSLALYQERGAPVRDEQGRPTLDVAALTDVFTFYQKGSQAVLLPLWLTQFQDEDQAWEAYNRQRADMVIAWSSRYLGQTMTDTAAAPLPTADGKPFTLATGWVWALASPQAERQAQAVKLAEYLVDSSFLASWTEKAGLLPTRPSALKAWENQAASSLAGQVCLSAHLTPSADVLASLGPALQQATLLVLKQQSEPQAAAQKAASSLNFP